MSQRMSDGTMTENDSTAEPFAIDLTGVAKEYESVTALESLDLTVKQGEIYGFLGPNGAGKSTTIDLMLDFRRPTSGTVELLGFDGQEDSQAVRKRVGILPDGYEAYGRLTGRQHLEFAIESMDADDSPEAIAERVGIEAALDRKASGYSKGMSQRLMFGAALVGEPELLILDEPSSGLDPAGAREMRAIVREERDRGATVFFSSHVLEQVNAVCDRVGILRNGTLVAEDTVAGLREATNVGASLHLEVDRVTESTVSTVRSRSGVSTADVRDGTLVVSCENGAKQDVVNVLTEEGVSIRDFTTHTASLEDVFIAYTKESSGR